MKIEKLSVVLRFFLEVVFIVGTIDVITLYWTLPRYFSYIFPNGFLLPVMIDLTLCGIFTLVIIRYIISMLKTVHATNPFIPKNVTSLKALAICCFIITVLLLGLFVFGGLSIVVSLAVLLFLVLGVLCLILSELFQKAVAYKKENDLTV